MLDNTAALATVAVRDMDAARRFYEGTLGLKPQGSEGDEAVEYEAGPTRVLVYRSQYAGTNKATAVTWGVNDVDGTVEDLKARGVVFEHYDDLPGVTRRGDVHHAGDLKNAWFKDPDGNIHALVGRDQR
jgi:catechol 2,3-dioxygenase-like lactoylglutathione lyase family enzyme